MNKQLLICDLDDTLYNWKGYFVPSFYAMVDRAVDILGCGREELLDDMRRVHQLYHDSEHPFALLETATVQRRFPAKTKAEKAALLDDAFHAFNSTRKKTLKLYPGVREGLEKITCSGATIVAHTESKLHGVIDRLTRFELSKYFKRIYCRERSESQHPNPVRGEAWLAQFPMVKVVELSLHQRKPDPDVLFEICSREGVTPDQCAYIGDSMARDVFMAKETGVFAAWAKYGTDYNSEVQKKLVRVTHWTRDDVRREVELREKTREIVPDLILDNSFAEIFQRICFSKSSSQRTARSNSGFQSLASTR